MSRESNVRFREEGGGSLGLLDWRQVNSDVSLEILNFRLTRAGQ